MNLHPPLRRFVLARLSPEGAFGLHLTVGVALLLLAAVLFGNLAEEVVTHQRITVFDLALSQWFHGHKHSGWTPFMLLVTHAHGTLGVLLMALLLGLYFQARRLRYWLLSLVLAVPGGMLLNVMLKYTFQRARPHFDEPLLTLASYSFPSGHTVGAALLYGLLCAFVVRSQPRLAVRGAAIAAALAMVLLVGLSRIYLGAHYLSDVLAAMVEAAGWLSVCITASSTLRRRRAAVAPVAPVTPVAAAAPVQATLKEDHPDTDRSHHQR